MGAYKQFLASDIIVTPFEVNKGFTFYSTPNSSPDSVDYPCVRINRLLGHDFTSSIFHPSSSTDPTTGYVYPGLEGGSEYQRLVYKSIQHLYYSNYLTSSYGDIVNRRDLIPGNNEEGNVYTGSLNNPSYVNYLQTNLTYPRFFPSQYSSGNTIAIVSIPNGLFGDYIKPTSFKISFPSASFYDDGEGNILTGSNIVGNIIYTHGIAILTGNTNIYDSMRWGGIIPPRPARYNWAISLGRPYDVFYGTDDVYGDVPGSSWWHDLLNNLVNSNDFTCSFSSSYTIYETQYKCTVRENEFNLTLNPSAISGGNYNINYDDAGKLYDFVTGSYFHPYITTVGLYDDQQNLLAVGKLSQPVPSSPTTDTTILINIDR